jgi:glycosyltransferase involved in cell wall biosynthesis
MKILIVGSLSSFCSSKNISGTVISLKTLISYLDDRPDIDVDIVDVSSIRGSSGRAALEYFKIFSRLLQKTKNSDIVMYNLSPDGFFYFSPCIWISSIIRRNKHVFRLFGGRPLSDLPFFKKMVSHYTLQLMDLILFQTDELINSAPNSLKKKIKKLVTSRQIKGYNTNCYCDKKENYFYLGHIKKDKGIFELIEAFSKLDVNIQVDIYGPLYDGIDESVFLDADNVNYKGTIEPEDVVSIIGNYKALLFPSYLAGEGYPGAIIESFSQGIPVLASNWKALPELVDEKCGIIFEPKSAEAIMKAVKQFEGYSALERIILSDNAFSRYKYFKAEVVNDNLINMISDILNDG